MVKDIQKNSMTTANELFSVFGHFVGLALKGLRNQASEASLKNLHSFCKRKE